MVAIVAGNGLGLLNTSLNIIGGAGVLGQRALGQGGGRAFVNAASGNLALLTQDEQLAGRGLDLYALRAYNSLGALNDGDGDGWRWGYEQTARFQGPGTPAQPQAGATVIRTTGDGHETTFTWNAARAAFIGAEGSGAHDELRYDSAPGEWVWTDGSTRVTERYSNSTSSSMTGRLIRRTDTSNNSIVLMYDAGGRLTLIQDTASQQELRLTYGLFNGLTRLQRLETRALIEDASGRATATLGAALRQVEYNYDSVGRLTTVTTDLTPDDGSIADGAVFVTNYTYDATTARIAGVTQSDGTSVFFTYDAAGRVSTVKDQGGATGSQLVFTYSATTNSTAITDGNGQVWTYRYDATTKQLTEILTPAVGGAALSTKFTYDASGNLVSVTDARNNTVTYGYDSNGNRTLERDALGDTVTRTFSTLNQMLTETRYGAADPDGAGAQSASDPLTTRYVYDANSRLRFVVSAEGRVTENRYGTASVGYGLLTHTLLYVGQVYDLTGLSPAAPLTEAQLTAWVAGLQDKTQAQLTEYSYDLRGAMSRQTIYAAVSATGAGVLDGQASVMEYIYDAHSQLRQRTVVRGGARDLRTVMTSFAYDGMGRVLTSTDANGAQTTVYDDANRNITGTAASGLTETRSYDSRRRLVSMRQTGDGATRETRYVYNNADQLRMVEDAQGGRRYRFYDAAGRLEYEVDATGAVARSEYNATGQLVRQTQYLNRADTSSWYDSATQTVTKLSLTVGGAGSDVLTDATRDRVTTFGYDAAGRLTTSTDAANTVTTTSYDGASRVVMTQTADRVTRYLYDKDNRKVGSVDALGYLTEYKYDAGGRLIETVRYSQRSPAAVNMAAPVWIGVSNQNATAGRPFEYRMPATDADGDSLSFSFVGTPPAWLSLDAGAGVVTLKGTPPNSLTSYDVTLRADDSRGKTSDVTLRITVADSPPSWGQLPDSAVPTNATGFSLTLPPATDNESATTLLTYSIRSALPPGLTFNAATRAISGAPTTPGMYTITARVTDPQGLFTDRSFLLQVTNIGPTWAPVPVQATWINQAFTFTVPAAADPEGQALTYSVISKPSWLSFNPTTRTLSGAPSTLGLQAVALEAQDAFGETVRLSFSIDVGNRAPTWGSLPAIVAQAGSPIAYTPPAAIDPDGELLIYSASGLPAGLLLDTTNGRISGISNAVGLFAVTLRATDPHGASVERSVSLRLNNAAPVYNGGLSDIQLQGPRFSPISLDFSFPASAFTDGNGNPLTYTASGAPGWLNFDSATRRFSGSSSIVTNQNFLVTVTASDTYGATASGSFGLSVMVKAGGFLTASTPSLAADTTQALAAIAPEADVLSSVRPTSADGLHSYQYYDGQGRVVGSVNEQGFLSETVYDEQANKQQSVRYLNAVAVAPTDTLATLKTKAGSAKQTTTIESDGFGRVSRSIGVDGTVMRNEYDSAGRLVRQVSADSTGEQRASRTRYNAFGEVTGTLGGVGEATLGVNPTQAAIDAAIASYGTRYEYNSLGQRIKEIDANNNPTWFYYDGEGRLTHTVNALGEVAETKFNPFGEAISARLYATRLAPAVLATLTGGQTTPVFLAQVQALTNAGKDQNTTFDYDQRGLLVKQTDGLGFGATNTYNTFGQLATQTRTIATGKTTATQYNYNLRGELISQTGDIGGLNFNTQTVYDAFGRITQSIDAGGKVTTTSYQDDGRTIEVTDPLNRIVRSQYDAFARALKTTDASGQATTYAYDDVNRSVKVTTPEGITFTTNKTRHGETLNVVDGRGAMTQYAYNKDGQQTTVTDALSQVIANTTYDRSGRKLEVTDARGTVTRFGYDQRNRVVERRVDPAGLNLTTLFEFNALGQQIKVTEGANTAAARVTTYAYDRKNQLTQVIVDPNGLKLSTRYTFDGVGGAVKVEQGTTSSPSQRVTLVEFDQLGRRVKEIVAPSAVFGPGSPNARDLTTEHRYDAAGRPSCTIHPDGASTWYVYDAAGQQIQTINAMGEVSESVYDANGRVAQSRRYFNRLSAADLAKLGDSISAPAPPQVNARDQRSYFVYDNDGRQRYTLQAFIESSWTIAENRFDANGNIVETRRYDKFLLEARLNAIDTGASPGISVAEIQAELITLGYSDADSALAKTQRTRFAYDANNRLRFTVDALGSVSESVYDPAGQLVSGVRYATRPALTAFTESAINAALNRADAGNQVSRYAYDAAGRLRYSVLALAIDAAGKPTRQLVSEQAYDSLGRVTQTISYATLLGPVADYKAATLAGAITAGAQDRRSAFVYDAAGRKVYSVQAQIAGSQNIVSKRVFDALDRLVESTSYAKTMALADFGKATLDSATITNAGAQDRTTRFVYDAVGRQRFVVGADGSLSEKVYDALGRVKESRQFDLPLSNTTPGAEDALSARRAGRAVGDGITRGEKYSYDRAGRLLTTTDAAAFTETNEYNGLGDKTSFIDKNGAKWRYVYDRQGRLFDQFSPSAPAQLSNETEPTNRSLQTRFYLDAFGNLFKRVEALQTVDQRITEYAYDRLGRQIVMAQPGWYDPATGRVEASSAAGRFQRTLETTYDALGNQVRTKLRMGINSYQYEYKTYDNLARVAYGVNALSNVTAFAYNAFGEEETVTRYSVTISGTPLNGVYWTAGEIDPQLNWGRDENGNLLEDAYARRIRLEYDQLGRKSSVTLPTATFYSTRMPGDTSQSNPFRPNPASVVGAQDAAETRYEYNAFGDTTLQRVRANNIVEWQDTSFTYDAMGRRTRSVDAAGNVTAMFYDAVGNLARQEERAPSTAGADRISEFAYNVLGQQTRVDRYGLRYTDANGVDHGMVEWTWEDGGGWLDPDADVANTVRTATYEGYGRPLVATDAAGNVTTMRYNALGQLVQVIAPARLVAPLAANGEGAVDPFRNQLSETFITSMTLDAFGRAVRQVRATSQGGDTRETLQSYDAAGNLVSATDAEGNVKERACDPAGRVIRETQAIQADLGPLGINGQGLERRYAYDALGQLTDTLDVYVDGADLAQSGKSAAYNAFGEVWEERRKWGPASQSPAALNSARVAAYQYDNAGHVQSKVAADGTTNYYYNLLGQVTREEKTGNHIAPYDGTGDRVTEIEYDVLGRETMIRRPAFDADITPHETGTTLRLVTPYSSRSLDRWGNVTGTEEGGYEFVNGQPAYAGWRIFRTYGYDDNNQLVTEYLGTHGCVSSSGVSTNAQISKLLFRDLLGNVVKEVDEAREPQTEALIGSRTRRKQYNSVGQLTAEIDATGRKVEYAYNIYGERLGTRNARGAVFFDRYDRNGNVRFHGVLRTASQAGDGEYNSFDGTGTIVRAYLNAYLYDQANRRFASKSFTEGPDAPWSYTWLDGRNFGVQQRDAMGIVTQCRYDQFGNKAVEIDGAGARTEWNAATTDYVVGRIETYRQPADSGFIKFGSYTYNNFGQLKIHALGNTSTEYDRHKNGLAQTVTIMPDVTQPSVREITTYQYDARGQLTSESRIDSNSIQTKYISYDTQGRLARVEDQNKAPAGPTSDVRYAYDEWSNVRRIQADYMQTWAEGPRASDDWYAYDEAGRMTVSNGALSGGAIQASVPGSAWIDYDAVGRRSETRECLRKNRTLIYEWDTMRDERYEYDDIGHLRRIEQRVRDVNIVKTDAGGTVSEPDRVGQWHTLSTRASNLRGDVTQSDQWARISGTPFETPARLGATTTAYRADGQVSWTRTDAVDPKKSTETVYTYNTLTGLLDQYSFNAFRADGAPFATTFNYQHSIQNGQRVVQRIRDAATGFLTLKSYDPLGRLSSERVDLQKPNGDGSDRYEVRSYEYGADGRIIFKDTFLRLSANGPGTEPLPTPSTGQQTYVFAGDRTVATVGAERLAGATKFDFAYTPMSEAAGGNASRYVVQSGDSVIDIAQRSYGDGALWYVIADANGITAKPDDPLPTTEVGKAYEIPGVIRSSHNASTFKPYELVEIIGNDRPIAIPPPPPPKYSDIEIIAVAAASITIQVGATIGLSALGVPLPVSVGIGAGLGNLAGQATSWGLGMQAPGQDGINWGGVGIAATEGFVFSALGPAGALTREIWQQGKSGFDGWTSGPGLNWTGIMGSLFNVGFDALSPVLGGPSIGERAGAPGQFHFNFSLAGLINSAYNPSSGWAIPSSGRSPAIGAFGYFYSAAASGLASMGFDWIRDQLKQPSAPAKVASARWMQAKFEGAATDLFEGAATDITEIVVDGRRYSAEVAPSTGQLVVVINGRRYWGEVDRSTGQLLWLEPVDAPTLSVRGRYEDIPKVTSAPPPASMVESPSDYSFVSDPAYPEQLQRRVNSYTLSAGAQAYFMDNPFRTRVNDAHAYASKVSGFHGIEDMERLARSGRYTHISVGTGVHQSSPNANMTPDRALYESDEWWAGEIKKQHPVEIMVWDLNKTDERAFFNDIQAAAKKGAPFKHIRNGRVFVDLEAGSFATIGDHCYSASQLPEGLPAGTRWDPISGLAMKTGGLLNLWSAIHVDDPYVKSVGLGASVVEIFGSTLYFGGVLTAEPNMIKLGGNIAGRSAGVGLTVVSGYTFYNDVKRGDVGAAIGSGANTAVGVMMLVGANNPYLRTFAVSYNLSRAISQETGWGRVSGEAGAALANRIMGDNPTGVVGAVRTGVGYAAGFTRTAVGTLYVEPVVAGATKIGQGATWAYDKVTDLIGYEFAWPF